MADPIKKFKNRRKTNTQDYVYKKAYDGDNID